MPSFLAISAAMSERRPMLARDYEHVHRRLWIDVAKGEGVFVLGNELRGNLLSHDSAEEAVVSHS